MLAILGGRNLKLLWRRIKNKMRKKMNISQLTFLGFYLNGAQGSEKYNYLTIEKVKEELEKGNFFQFLQKEMGSDIDTSILSDEEKNTLNTEWLNISQAIDEGRKMSVDNGGLCLLVAYIFESIQYLKEQQT
jgi:hypothetical protein